MSIIMECKNIELIKNSQTILTDISFSIQAGDSIGIIGPSGSGKSSLFRLLNLLMSPTQGQIFYRNKNIQEYAPTELRRRVSYILQKPYLIGNTVKENLVYPYQLLNQKPNLEEINSYLTKVNLSTTILEKKNTALSGGEQQRIALIRSLLIKPEIILLDEVTAALDEENTLLLEKLIINEQQIHNITLLFITHNKSQAKRLAKKIIYLEAGKIHFFGDTAHYFLTKGGQNE
jgi:putative ABC transport system ATP-binding protein